MHSYMTGLFHLGDTDQLLDFTGQTTLDQWLRDAADNGYHLVGPCQLTSNDSGIWALATLEYKDDDEDDDDYTKNYEANR